ncbi:MAG: hypothetical protein ACLFUJ_14450 [Phycisphaerae bacterium]
MKLRWTVGLLAAQALWLAGCGNEMQGTSRQLGDVPLPMAFAASRDVLSDYFSIASAQPDTGLIRCRPKPIDSPSERLLSGARPARHVCTMQLRQEGQTVVGTLSIAIQRQGSEAYQAVRMQEENYGGVPDRTPAQMEGATTPEQNDVWTTTRQDKNLEMRLLGEIRQRLQPSLESP